MRRGRPGSGKLLREIRSVATVGAATNLKARYRIRAQRTKPLAVLSGIMGLGTLAPLMATNIWAPVQIAAVSAVGLIAFLASLPPVLSARAHGRHIRFADQRIRDLRAAELYSKLKAGEPVQGYSLYLRPFKSTNDLRLVDPREAERWDDVASSLRILGGSGTLGGAASRVKTPDFPAAMATDTHHLEFEGAIMAALATRAPMVCLGQGLEHVGAGRIEVPDAEWQDAVVRLVFSAELIIIAPSSQPGTLWEVEHLSHGGFVDRTIFVDMPDRGYRGRRWKQRKEWGAITAMLRNYGYELPDETETGLFLYFGNQKTPKLATPIGKLEISRLGSFFDAVMKDLAGARLNPADPL